MAREGEFDLYYFDESGLSLDPCVPYAWQDIVRSGTSGIPASRSKRINLLGFMDWTGTELTAFEHEGSVNSDVIIDVMEEFCEVTVQTPLPSETAGQPKISELRLLRAGFRGGGGGGGV
jgi:hypothetical protein